MLRALALALGLAMSGPSGAATPFPLDMGGAFDLVDQNGQRRTQADPDGHMQLLFFGFANCQNICSAALPLMAQVAEDLQAAGHGVTPMMITIDPSRDTVDAIGAPLERHHPDFVGLTGSEAALKEAYAAFNVSFEPLFMDPEHGWVFAHTGFIFVLDGAGDLLTLLPPAMAPEQMTGILKGYLTPGG